MGTRHFTGGDGDTALHRATGTHHFTGAMGTLGSSVDFCKQLQQNNNTDSFGASCLSPMRIPPPMKAQAPGDRDTALHRVDGATALHRGSTGPQGAMGTQHFTGVMGTQHFTESMATQHFTGSMGTQHFTESTGTQHFTGGRRGHSTLPGRRGRSDRPWIFVNNCSKTTTLTRSVQDRRQPPQSVRGFA